MNFNNEVTEIPFVQFLLPNVHEVPKGGSAQRRSAEEKTNCGNQVVEIQGGEERKKDCGNQVAEIQGREKKKGMKKKKLWQAKYERKKQKQKQKEWYFFFFF